MFVKENTLNDKFCFFGWSLRIHYYCFMFRWKIWLTRSKLRCMAMEKRENSIKISFNFNHLIPYRISVWLVSFLFLQKKKNHFLEDMTSLSLSLQQSTIEEIPECPIKNSRQPKSSELPVSSQNWHKCIFKG